MEKARITYRFDRHRTHTDEYGTRDGAEQKQAAKIIPLYQREFELVEEDGEWEDQSSVELNRYTNDFGRWKSPIEAETERIERLIRESGKSPFADVTYEPEQTNGVIYDSSRSDDDGRESVYGYMGPFYYEEHLGQSKTRIQQHSFSPPWFKIGISVAGAVLTGVFFGFFVLTMFSDDVGDNTLRPNDYALIDSLKPPLGASPDSGHQMPGMAAPSTLDALQTGGSSMTRLAVHIPERTFSILQTGVFSTKEAAETQRNDLYVKGLAAVVETLESGDKHAVYSGIASSGDEALALSYLLQQEQIEVYNKSFVVPEVTQVQWRQGIAGNATALADYFAQGDQLVRLLEQQTVDHLRESRLTPIDAKMLQAIKTAHQSWSGLSSTLANTAADQVKQPMQQMSAAMNTAIVALEEYRKNPSTSYLWQTQTSMMQYLLAERSLIALIAAR